MLLHLVMLRAAHAQPNGGRLKLLARGETVPEFDDIAFNAELGVVHGTCVRLRGFLECSMMGGGFWCGVPPLPPLFFLFVCCSCRSCRGCCVVVVGGDGVMVFIFAVRWHQPTIPRSPAPSIAPPLTSYGAFNLPPIANMNLCQEYVVGKPFLVRVCLLLLLVVVMTPAA